MANELKKIIVDGVEYTLPEGGSGRGLTLVGNYPIEYSEVDVGYRVIHPISKIPPTSLYVELKNPEHAQAIFTGLLSYASATIISGYGYMYGTSISVPNANATLSLLWVVDPDFANSLIDLRLSISSNSQLVPLDGYIISVYTLD